MMNRKVFAQTRWKRTLVAIALATPLVAVAGGSGVSAGTQSHVSYDCDDSEELELIGPYISAEVPEGNYGKPLATGDVTTESGPPADILLFVGNVRTAYLNGVELEPLDWVNGVSQGDTEYFEDLNQGLYTVVFDYPPDYKYLVSPNDATITKKPVWAGGPGREDDVIETILVYCGGGNPNFNFNFNLPTVTTPPLPKTGGESHTLLILAPVMVLLGGGLVLARRRLIDA